MSVIDKFVRRLKPTRTNSLQIITGDQPRVLNYASQGMRRALISYLVQPVIDELQNGNTIKFSNDGIARTWPKVLENLGYSVDIINWDDTTYKSNHNYDVIIGHGAINFDHLRHQFPKSTYVYFSTGSYWQYHNQQEDARLTYFEKRHGVKLPHDRYITKSEEDCNATAAGIIALGNAEVAKTYDKFKKVINVPIGCFPDNRYEQAKHDFAANRKNFLFFSGAGNIHKGLDLLIDVFKEMPDYTLHICTFIDKEFGNFYKKDLELPNILMHDFVDLRSDNFYKIIDQCNYVIFPSCSEGSPGSVVECMMQGIIPIVSKDAHLDVGTAGIILSDCSTEKVKAAVKAISTEPLPLLRKRSATARRIASTTHSPDTFAENLLKALDSLLKDRS